MYDDAINKIIIYARSGEPVPVDEVPLFLKKDFDNFMFGESVLKNEKGQYCARVSDFIRWTKKIVNQGFDYKLRLIDDGN